MTGVDSLVLERTPCFGFCPTYRLSIARTGVVQFASNNRGDSVRAVDTIPMARVDALLDSVQRISFWTLPDVVRADSTLCPVFATDHPSIIVSIFGVEPKSVDYYTGCYTANHERAPSLRALSSFAEAMDSATSVARWTRPNR